MMEQLIVAWDNSICCLLENIQMDSIFGLWKNEPNQYEKLSLIIHHNHPRRITIFWVSTHHSCRKIHGFIFNHKICFWIYEQ